MPATVLGLVGSFKRILQLTRKIGNHGILNFLFGFCTSTRIAYFICRPLHLQMLAVRWTPLILRASLRSSQTNSRDIPLANRSIIPAQAVIFCVGQLFGYASQIRPGPVNQPSAWKVTIDTHF